jgi:hypothetical protein
MPYSADINRSNPTCFLFLIDQSRSMAEPFAGAPGKTKAEGVADAINSLLCNLCLTCQKGQTILDRLFVGVIGYGERIAPGLGGPLAGRDLVPISAVACHPLRIEQRPRPGGSAASFPVWFDPLARGKTPMCAALDLARTLLAGFLAQHPDCFPPVVINISDGMANDGDPQGPSGQLRQLSSSDGNVLLFNAHLSARDGSGIMLPDSEAGLPDAHARLLFRMSSVLPAPIRASAGQAGFRVSAGTRGFVFNANLDLVVQFLRVGTTYSPSRA